MYQKLHRITSSHVKSSHLLSPASEQLHTCHQRRRPIGTTPCTALEYFNVEILVVDVRETLRGTTGWDLIQIGLFCIEEFFFGNWLGKTEHE